MYIQGLISIVNGRIFFILQRLKDSELSINDIILKQILSGCHINP